jgi:hypothetical protein
MSLEEQIPDYGERAAFFRKLTLASAKAMHDLRNEKLDLTEDQMADELEVRIRSEIGPDFHLGRPQLLQLARDVLVN